MSAQTQGFSAPTIAATIADWATSLDVAAVPETARTAVANTIVDTVALSIASINTDYGRAVLSGAATPGPCTVFGAATTRSAHDAALINGTTAHGEDFDNTYEGCPVHSGVVIIPALLAVGEAEALSSARVALGMTAGIELMCRLGAVAKKSVHTQGFHPTSVLGTVAAAVGVGVARGYNAQQLMDTMGVAGSMASGIIEYLGDGSWTKRMHAGWAAQSGIRAADLGGAGFFGPRAVFEGTHGLFSAFGPSIEPDFDLLVGELGSRWEASRVAFKPYACGTMTQPFIDCGVKLREQGVAWQAVEEIVCAVGEGTVHRLWEPLAGKQSPPTPYAAKFSGPYTVACGLRFGAAGLAEFTPEAIANADLLSLSQKVRYEIDPDNEYPANYTGEVVVKLTNGQTFTATQNQLRGGVREPMEEEELLAKCQANLEFADWQGVDAAAISAFAKRLFSTDDVCKPRLLGA